MLMIGAFRGKQLGQVYLITQQRRERHLDAWLRIAPDTSRIGDVAEPVCSPDSVIGREICEIR